MNGALIHECERATICQTIINSYNNEIIDLIITNTAQSVLHRRICEKISRNRNIEETIRKQTFPILNITQGCWAEIITNRISNATEDSLHEQLAAKTIHVAQRIIPLDPTLAILITGLDETALKKLLVLDTKELAKKVSKRDLVFFRGYELKWWDMLSSIYKSLENKEDIDNQLYSSAYQFASIDSGIIS